jgi:hypothetical protein
MDPLQTVMDTGLLIYGYQTRNNVSLCFYLTHVILEVLPGGPRGQILNQNPTNVDD